MSRICNNCNCQVANDYDICPQCGTILENNSTEYENQLLPGRALKGRYIIGHVVGYGGFGITYAAMDNLMNTPVAIKEYYPFGIVDREFYSGGIRLYRESDRDEFMKGLDRFLGEARELAKFNQHSNIVSVLDFFTENETAYMVMEFLDGQTLDEYIKMNGGTLKEPMLTQTIFSVCEALEIVHNEGVIHRDISPDNIFICSDMTIKIIDFGAAKQFFATESKTVSVVLKHGFAPPEQYVSKGKFGPWTDIYALGATLYKAITGTMPIESVGRIVEDGLVPPSEINADIPKHLSDAIMKAMAIKVADRYQNIEEFRLDLLSGIEEAETTAKKNDESEAKKTEKAVVIEDSSKTENRENENKGVELKDKTAEVENDNTISAKGKIKNSDVEEKDDSKSEEISKPSYVYKDKEKEKYLEEFKEQKVQERQAKKRNMIRFAAAFVAVSLVVIIILLVSNNTYYIMDEVRSHIENGEAYSDFVYNDSELLDIDGMIVFDDGLKLKTYTREKVDIVDEGIYLKFKFNRKFSEAENGVMNIKVHLQKKADGKLSPVGYGKIFIESENYILDNVKYDFVNGHKGYCVIDIGKLEPGTYKLTIETKALDRKASVTFKVK